MTPQLIAGVELLRGFGAAFTKSALLLSVSVQPLLILNSAVVLLGAPVAPLPSKQLAPLPYPTRSITELPSEHDADKAVGLLTSATFAAVALMLIAPIALGVGRSVVPADPCAS